MDFHAPLILGGAAYGVTKILEVVNKLLADIKAFFHHGGVSMPQCANATLETPSYDPISARCVACYDIANASERCPTARSAARNPANAPRLASTGTASPLR